MCHFIHTIKMYHYVLYRNIIEMYHYVCMSLKFSIMFVYIFEILCVYDLYNLSHYVYMIFLV